MDGVIRCARDFFDYARYAEQGLPLCEDTFEGAVIDHINRGIVILLVDEGNVVRGGISGMPAPWTFNRNIKMMLEFFFWIDPGYRGLSAVKMMRAFERTSRTYGADFLVMVAVHTHLFKGVAKLYEKMGYRPTEQFFIKKLSGDKT